MSTTQKHYAFLNNNNVVVNVLVYEEEDLPEAYVSFEDYYGESMGMLCKRTCPDTVAGSHNSGGTPFRGNYAQPGYIYDEILDAFIAKQPYPSWTFNEETYSWEAPVPYPEDSEEIMDWLEKQQRWYPVDLDK